MNVILIQAVKRLGAIGETISVKPGYARNFLIPQGKAVIANKNNIATVQAKHAALVAQSEQALKLAHERAETAQKLNIVVTMRASEEGKLFGSVGAREIAMAFEAAGFQLKKQEVLLPSHALKELGTHSIKLQLHEDVLTSVNIQIVAQQ